MAWTALAEDDQGGSTFIGYELNMWDSASSSWVNLTTTAADATEYEHTGLTPDTTYYYILRAVNNDGPGPWSQFASDDTGDGAPDVPDLEATAIDSGSIRLSWNRPADNGMAIMGYQLQRWVLGTGNGNGDWADQLTSSDSNADTIMYIDTGEINGDEEPIEPGKTYYYQVQAIPASGYSAIATVTTPADAPAAPELVREPVDADVTHDSITLRWSDTEPNGSAIVRYELQTWNTTSRQWETVNNSILASSRSITVSSLDAETRYAYRLRAVNRADADNGLGAWSTILFVTTEPADE